MRSLRWKKPNFTNLTTTAAAARSHEPFDPTFRYATSWLLPPLGLALYRALVSIYAFVTLLVAIGWQRANGRAIYAGRSFSYFTNLTYWGLAFYFAFAAAHSASYALRGTPFLARWPRLLQVLHSVLYSTVVTFPILVTVVFWAILYSTPFPTTFNTWENVSVHALNTVFALLEIILPRTPRPPFLHLIPIVLILALYLALAFITYADQGFYTYDFLDHRREGGRGRVAAFVFGILAAAAVVFSVVHLLVWLRLWLTESRLGMTGKFSRRDASRVPSALSDVHRTGLDPEMAAAPPIPPKAAGRAARMSPSPERMRTERV